MPSSHAVFCGQAHERHDGPYEFAAHALHPLATFVKPGSHEQLPLPLIPASQRALPTQVHETQLGPK